MKYIYKNQSKLRIVLATQINLTDCTCVINYIKPSSAEGHWDATILGCEENGLIYYDVENNTILDEEGTWYIWAGVTFDDASYAPGQTAQMIIYPEGYPG